MKDIVITPKALRREGIVALCCFAVAFCVNLYAVVRFDRPAIELLSQLGFVVAIAVGLYVIQLLVRLLIFLVSQMFRK